MKISEGKRTLLYSMSSMLFVPLLPIKNIRANYTTPSGFVFDDIFLTPIFNKNHPEQPERIKSGILEVQSQLKISSKIILLPIRSPDIEIIKLIHTSNHINSLNNKYSKKINSVILAGVGSVLSACDSVHSGKTKNAFVASRPPGHHARNSGKEEGFCFYNNIAIAAKYLQKKFNYKKILIVDWDYHHGDGTEQFFYDDPSVLFFSTHDWHAYPRTGDPKRKGVGKGYGYNINVHLKCGSSNQDIQNAFLSNLIPAAEKFKPDFILISAGFDSKENDTLGCFKVNDEGYNFLTRLMINLAKKYSGGKLISVLEGGYNPKEMKSSILSHIIELSNY